MIRPAGEEAQWKVIRIDEVTEPGQISNQYLKQILEADLVLADISVPNANVFYELGIRHAVSAGGTILLANERALIPFDLASQRVIFYNTDSFRWEQTKNQIRQYLESYKTIEFENPVKGFLEKMGASATPRDIAAFEKEISGRIDRSKTVDQLIAVWHWVKNYDPIPILSLLTLAEKISDYGEWLLATDILKAALILNPNDYEIFRKIGWYLQQAGEEYDNESLKAFENALALNPFDPETLGMMGGRLKRQGKYEEAEVFYDKGASVSPNSVYILINQAAVKVLNNPTDDTPEGIELYKKLIAKLEKKQTTPDEWDELVLGEAFFVVGDLASAKKHYGNAIAIASTPKSLASAKRQLEAFANEGFRTKEAELLIEFLQPTQLDSIIEVEQEKEAERIKPIHLPIIIHLSDIHFGTKQKDGKIIDMHRFYDGENSQSLSKHLIAELTSKNSRFKGQQDRIQFVVSGDLTYNGSKEEFEKAKVFLNEVCSVVGIDKEKVHIIPGNHDVNWLLAKHDLTSRFDNYINFLVEFYGEDLFKKRYPKIKWPILMNDPRPNPFEIISYYADEASKLVIVGFNSCVYEDDQHHYGFIGERQLRLAKDLMEEDEIENDITRVALIHHHLHPFPEMLTQRQVQDVWLDLSTIRDAGHVERYLERLGFDLVLHGHKHKAQMRETVVRDPDPTILKREPKSLIGCGAGSISCIELEHNESSHYEIIELRHTLRTAGAHFVRVEWRIMPVTPGAEWRTLKTWDLLG